jgi:DNA-binding transcriptional LysR family regulator
MELYQLRTFLAVARTRNLTRAASTLATSQPALSAQLRTLEDELGVELFSRTSRGMELTAAGHVLRAKAEEIDARAVELLALARSMAGKTVGTCRVGLNTEARLLRVPELITALGQSAPRLTVELVQGVTRTIFDDVSSGKLDAGFVFGPHRSPELEWRSLDKIELIVAAPPAWKERLAPLTLEQVVSQPWVWPPRDCPFHEIARTLARAPEGGVTADDESTILRLVSAGIGISLLPAFMVEEAEAAGEVMAWRGTGTDIELGFVWRTRDDGSPLVRPLVQALQAIWTLE